MLFLFTGRDKQGCAELRQKTRASHRDHIHATHAGAKLVYGAPLADSSGTMCGTFLLIEADSPQAAARFIEQDPYIRVGLFADHQLTALHEAAPPLPFGGGK
ncbi:MAG: hypothetical protein ISP42_01055 [Alphaproteobacteria bacterium]|jgi:uncharacterized protein YciI|nr:hypothetical protein [Alphaproteobacteria bacterium]